MISSIFQQFRWQDAIDIVFVFVIVYQVLLLIRGTRSVHILTGLGIVAIAFIFSDRLGLFTLNYILRQFFDFLFLIIIILFQDEIKRALATIGKNPFLSSTAATNRLIHSFEEISKTAKLLSSKNVGSLIVIERQHGLKNYLEGSTNIEGYLSVELLLSVFHPSSPIHDGAVIVQGDKVKAAGCFFPINLETDMDRSLGTRHRAAISISEETDAVVVVTSEERGEISFVEQGQMLRGLSEKELLVKLLESFSLKRHSAIQEKRETNS